MQLTSLSLALTRAGFLSFSPASLFAAGEPGAWYEPSLTNGTCFQDSSGTTPVTAVEQPVGLILDKSKGLVLGPELVTNGDFSNGTTGWSSSTVYTSTSSVVDGVFRVNSTTNYGLQLQPISCVVGRAYVITGQARRGTVMSAAIGASVNANGAAAIALATTTSSDFVALRCQFVATSTTMYIVLGGSAGSPSGYHEYDNISVRELPGNHATQTTSTSRPVLSARYNLLTKTEQFDDGAWVKSNVTIVANTAATPDPLGGNTADLLYPSSTGSIRFIYQVLGVNSALTRSVYVKAAGKSVFYIDLTGSGNQHAFFDLSNGTVGSVQSGYTASIESVGNGWYRCSVSNATAISYSFGGVYGVADANGSTAVTADGTSGIYIWGASLVPANQAALPYQRVNTATDYDADPSKFKPYLRFDGVDDWLVTPTITPGIDKAQVFAGVRKLSDAAAGMLVELSFNALSNNGAFYFDAPEDINNRYLSLGRGNAAGAANQAATVGALVGIAPDTAVMTVTHDIAGDLSTIRRNAAAGTSGVGDKGTGNFLAYPLYIGRRGGTTVPFNGHIYGLIVRFGANLPAATIASTETWLNGKTGAY